MTEIAIRVEGLSKKYRIGLKERRHETFMGAVVDWFRQPVRNFRNLRKLTRFDDGDEEDVIWALRDVSFEVRRGEVVGIIGRNGAGKSTLLKVLARITEPTAGRAVVNGRVGSLLEVGTGMHGELTGRENIYLSGTILGMTKSEIDRKFDEIVEFAELGKFIDTPVKRYSTGMKVRLGFAIAAHLEPEILLIDEVLAVGDAAFQKKCLGKMGDVARAGRTVLFVSHNMAAVASLTKRSLWIHHGNVLMDGRSPKVIDQYLTMIGKKEDQEFRQVTNDVIDLLSCSIMKKDYVFDVREPVPIQIVCRIKKPVKKLRIGFDLENQYGIHLFRSYHDENMKELQELRPGVYRFLCKIPPYVLNTGLYYINLRAGIHGVKRLFVLEHVKYFHVANLSGFNSRYGGKPGLLNLNMDWKVEADGVEKSSV